MLFWTLNFVKICYTSKRKVTQSPFIVERFVFWWKLDFKYLKPWFQVSISPKAFAKVMQPTNIVKYCWYQIKKPLVCVYTNLNIYVIIYINCEDIKLHTYDRRNINISMYLNYKNIALIWLKEQNSYIQTCLLCILLGT